MRIAPRRGRARLFALLAVFALVLAGCAKDAPQDFLNHQSGDFAKRADALWDVTFIIATVIFFIVEGLIVFAVIRFRQKPGREAKQFHGNTKVEIALTLIPAMILAGIGVPTVKAIFDLAKEPANAMQITVVARQFWWEYRYESEELVTANELHIPVGRPVRLTLEGDVINKDVIHSFWVPRLAGTQDVVPGRVNYLSFTAEEPGVYLGQCKEFCGLSHANMRLRVIAETPAEFDQWVADQQQPAEDPSDPLAAEGAELFQSGEFANGPPCMSCHTIDGTDAAGTLGPNLTHLASRETFAGAVFELNEANLSDWLHDPPGVKPGVRMPDLGLTEDQVRALVAYLMSLE